VSERDVDVVVIGAGVVGCTVARAGVGGTACGCDPRLPGGGASFASAGVLAPHEATTRGRCAIGRRSLAQYPAFVDRVAAAAGVPVAFRPVGTAEVATNDADITRLARSKVTADAEGVTAHWLQGTAAREAEPALAAHAAGVLHIPIHAAVDVPALTTAAATAARKLGAVRCRRHGAGARGRSTASP
jgi:glycine oxidase